MATIQGVYVALFGRPADPTGLAYFNSVTNNGANLNAISNLSGQPEYIARFAGFNNVQVVTAIYQSLFNRAPEATGLNFFVDALNKGTLNINNVAIAILDGAQGSDKTIVDTKVAAANAFTAQLDTPTEIATYVGNDAAASARAWLAGVTTTAPTATQIGDAIKALNVGVTLTVGAAGDVLSPTAATAALKTSNNDDTISSTAANLAGTKIDAGLGTDTLNVTAIAAAGITLTNNISGVEKLYLTAAAGATVTLDTITGLSEVWNKASTAANDVVVNGLVKTNTLGLEGTNGATTFGFKATEVSGAADVATLALKSSANTTVTVDGIETLNIATSGTASSITSLAGSTLKDVKITGDIGGSVTFASTTLKSVDASAVNGSGVTINVAAAETGVTVTGSKFGETITLNAVGATTTDKDVIVYNKANISVATTAQHDTITGFTSGEDKLDLKAFALTGGKAAVTNFGAAPVENQDFLGNAMAYNGTELYVDSNNDGKYNAATDFSITVTGGANVVKVTDVIFA